MSNRPAFERVRIQMLFPCAAKCKWCRTYFKNPEFARLSRTGRSDEVHDFYLSVIKRYKPRTVAISGGEAILFPRIEKFLHRVSKHCDRIRLYTSYQYPTAALTRSNFSNIDPDQLTLAHSIIHFLPDQWHELTHGFPHDLYVANLRAAKALPFKKQIKFVLNHADSAREVEAFVERIEPDDRFELCYKLMNDQNNGFGKQVMRNTQQAVREKLAAYNFSLRPPDANVRAGVAQNDLLSQCRYRSGPVELRFALYRETERGVCLKVRFCSYFGANTYHKLYVGRDKLKKIDKWFHSGDYRSKCDSCRLLNYSDMSHSLERDNSSSAAGRAAGVVKIDGLG